MVRSTKQRRHGKEKSQLSAKTWQCRSRYAKPLHKVSHFTERTTSIVLEIMSANTKSNIIQPCFTAEIEQLKLSMGSPTMPTKGGRARGKSPNVTEPEHLVAEVMEQVDNFFKKTMSAAMSDHMINLTDPLARTACLIFVLKTMI